MRKYNREDTIIIKIDQLLNVLTKLKIVSIKTDRMLVGDEFMKGVIRLMEVL